MKRIFNRNEVGDKKNTNGQKCFAGLPFYFCAPWLWACLDQELAPKPRIQEALWLQTWYCWTLSLGHHVKKLV